MNKLSGPALVILGAACGVWCFSSMAAGQSNPIRPVGQPSGFGYLFVPLAPCRIVDTRVGTGPLAGPFLKAGVTRVLPLSDSTACVLPADAVAYSLNVTVVPHQSLAYLTIWDDGDAQPVASTLNSLDGRIKANAAIVTGGNQRAIDVYAANDTDLVLDINGYFVYSATASPSALGFYPVAPCRLVDTRANTALMGGVLIPGLSRTLPLLSGPCNIPATAQAYSLNVTVVPSGPLGYLTITPAGEVRPLVSTLNALNATITANAAIVPAGTNGSIDVYATGPTHLVIDINGYFAPPGPDSAQFYPYVTCRVLDSRLPAGTAPFAGRVDVRVAYNVYACGNHLVSSPRAYVLNATAIPAGGELAYLTLWQQGSMQPTVSTLNSLDGAIANNMAIVPSTNGSISASVTDPSYLVLDAIGYFQ